MAALIESCHLGHNNQKFNYNMNKSLDEHTMLQETLLPGKGYWGSGEPD